MKINRGACVFSVACSLGVAIACKTSGHEYLVLAGAVGGLLSIKTYCKNYGRNPDKIYEHAKKIHEFASNNLSTIICTVVGFGLPSLLSHHFSWTAHIIAATIGGIYFPMLAKRLLNNSQVAAQPPVIPLPATPIISPVPVVPTPVISLSPEVEGQTKPSAPPSPVVPLPLSQMQNQVEGQMKWQDEDQPGALPPRDALSQK